jgi:hypothetical protein
VGKAKVMTKLSQKTKMERNMNFLRYLLPAVAATGLMTSVASTVNAAFDNSYDQRDFEAVQEFVNSKRTVNLDEKASNLTLSGDVRFTWGNHRDKRNKVSVWSTEPDAGEKTTRNRFNSEFNLYVDYAADRSWAVAWLNYLNRAGLESSKGSAGTIQGSGSADHLELKKAYIGYNLFADGCSKLDVELGRRPRYNVFDSRVQFQDRFDGALLKFSHGIESWGDFFWNIGVGVGSDSRRSHNWVTELGLANIYDCGFDARYSYSDWKSLAHKSQKLDQAFNYNYQISQFSLAYHLVPEYLSMPAKIYGAFLMNHAAKGRHLNVPATNGGVLSQGKHGNAWYVGAIIGEVVREGDWAIDFNYQQVGAQAVPARDFSGVGASFAKFDERIVNVKGWTVEGLFAVTDNLSVNAKFETGRQEKALWYTVPASAQTAKDTRSLSQVKLGAIFAF